MIFRRTKKLEKREKRGWLPELRFKTWSKLPE